MSFPIALLSLVCIGCFFGGAVWGEGGAAAVFREPALGALAVLTGLMTVAALFTKANLSSGEREDRGNRWVVVALGAISVVAAVVPAYCDRIGVWTIGGESVRWLGIALYACGGVLRL